MTSQPAAPTRIAIFGPGRMGTAIAARLRRHGLDAVTCTEGRSAATQARVAAAQVPTVPLAALREADMLLSVVPPGAALTAARTLVQAGVLGQGGPLFADCNAVSPDTMRTIESLVLAAGATCVDGAIVGAPPDAAGTRTPVLYVAGPQAQRLSVLARHGLGVHVLDAPVGAASGFKLCFAVISKGLTALIAQSAIGADRAGFAQPLHAQLSTSLGQALAWAGRQAPMLPDKSGRWVDEMHEIAHFLRDVPGVQQMFQGAAEFYGWLDREKDTPDGPFAALARFFAE